MKVSSFALAQNASVSLQSIHARMKQELAPSPAACLAGFIGADERAVRETDRTTVLIETSDLERVGNMLVDHDAAVVESLAKNYISAEIGATAIEALLASPAIQRIQTKKQSQPLLTEALLDSKILNAGMRSGRETGSGVLVGVVDSGFDLSHPMFRDAGGRLRVDALLDQTDNDREFTNSQLESAWSSGVGPGVDARGHGTHVASIAAGSNFSGHEGVATGARLLLVKTDFINTDTAVSWIFGKAGSRPCVVNLSLGRHLGAHDGTDQEERLYRQISGPGKIIVAAAGNERGDGIHIGGRFSINQIETIGFDVHRRSPNHTFAVLTLWYDRLDSFEIDLISPFGQVFPVPATGNSKLYVSSNLDIELSRKPYVWSSSIQSQISLSFKGQFVPKTSLRGWGLRILCSKPIIGRIDGWVHNSGYAVFSPHALVESARTVAIPGTGDACITVASHVSKTSWQSDQGRQQDLRAVNGRSSAFSSLGPTRDGRWKPEISAPGQYVTAALADGSRLSPWGERARANARLVTIEGTSMAAPLVTGVIALMLQKNPTLTTDGVRRLLEQTATRDGHTGSTHWTIAYGHGKIDAGAVVGQV